MKINGQYQRNNENVMAAASKSGESIGASAAKSAWRRNGNGNGVMKASASNGNVS